MRRCTITPSGFLLVAGYLLAGAVGSSTSAGEPSFDLDSNNYRIVTADTLDQVVGSGVGTPGIKKAITAMLAGKPVGTRVRVALGTEVEGSSRWSLTYLVSAVPLDAEGRPDGEEMLNTGALVPWKNGVKDGIEKTLREGKVVEEVHWKDGKVVGTKRSFFPDGKVKSEVEYVDGLVDGPTRVFGADGCIVSEGTMEKGRMVGVKKEYWPAGSVLRREVTYRDGSATVVKEYDTKGRIQRDYTLKNESFHGEDRKYNEAGEVTQTRYWLNGDNVTKEAFKGKGK